MTLYRSRSDITFILATVVPMIAAVAGFSLWQGAHDHYWFLVLAPGAALTVAWALTAWRPAASPVAIVLLAIALLAQSPRLAEAGTIHRLPEYAPLARGSLEIRRYGPTIRRIETEFALPFTADATFLYEVLGGRVTNDAPFSARIARTGDVVFTPVAAQK